MKQKINNYIYSWNKKGYPSIPDEGDKRLEDLNKTPSYKKICLAILKNDHSMKSLGFSQKKSEWYNRLKRIEIENRNSKNV